MSRWFSVTWSKQRRLVNALSGRALQKRREARQIRGRLGVMIRVRLGSVDALTWVFAMGSLWAARRSPAAEGGGKGRSMIAAINTSLFAWQLINRQLDIAKPEATNPR